MTPAARALWTMCHAGDLPAGDAWLSPRERIVLEGLHVPKRRLDWRLGRWTAKVALGREPSIGDVQPARLEIRASHSGAPDAYLDGEPLPFVVSITHSEGVSVAALAPSPARLGCDLELVQPREPAFLEDWFTGDERSRLRVDPGERAFVATLLWSAKESALKALREGLRIDLRTLSVDLAPRFALDDPHASGRLRVTVGDPRRAFEGRWRRLGAHVLTLVADPPAVLAPFADQAPAAHAPIGVVGRGPGTDSA